MDPVKIAKQMISYQKTLFENSFKAMILIQDQTEKIAETFLNQLPWMNEESKKTINEQVSFYKKSRDDFKKAVDSGFDKFEEILVQK